MKLEFKKIGNLHKRWLTNITLVIVAVGVVCVAAITASYAAYCYKNMDADLQNRARTTTDYFKEAIGQDYDTFYQSCITYAETFDQADALELQFIDQYGKIVASSYGTWAATSPRTPEVQEAISTRTIQPFVGRDPDTGERIMAVSSPMIYSNGQVIGVLRYVTSTAIMDREIVSIAFISITVLVAALVIILLFSSFFIRSVMLPVEQITEKAKRIANGSYGAQIKTKYNDEIADLAETINEMSVKISQNEKMQAEFISQLSHELRTPLTAIRGWGETLLSDDDLDPETRRKGMQVIMGETERLSQMVEELLDFSRIQGGRIVLTRENVDLAAELSDVVLMYTERARRENKTLLYEEPEGVIIVYADRNRLRQVFINILDNAIKYSDGGDTVAVTLTTISGSAVISVADTGIGIAPEELPRVKDRFYKGKSSRRGSGIGLAVADEIIKMHGGSLKLTSRKGEGTTVTITLPLARG